MTRRLGHLVSLALLLLVAPVQALDKVSVIHSSVSGSQAILFVTRDAKIFEKHGLELDIRFVAGGSVSVQSLLAGDVQVAVMGAPVAVQAKLKGADMAIIVGIINSLDHVKQLNCFFYRASRFVDMFAIMKLATAF